MRKPRFKAAPDAPFAFYHCISRVVDRAFKLGDLEKEVFLRILRQYEAFCGVHIITYCIMSNHFHVLVEIPRRPDVLPSDPELFATLEALYTGTGMAVVRQKWDALAEDTEALSAFRASFFARMWDLSQFMKAVKQRFSHRKLLYATGALRGLGTAEAPARPGFTAEEVEAVWKEGGKLTIPELLGCRVRYFVDGAVLGSRAFVDEVFVRCRERFGARRKDGARPLRGVVSDLFCLRALRLRPIG